MTRFEDIPSYNAAQSEEDQEICALLQSEINKGLPEAESKIWHAHPVWFLDGNPIVGYHRLKHSLRLMFWSGQSFTTPGLDPEGTFKAAEVRYSDVSDVDVDALAEWLEESKAIQWNYRDIRKHRGLVKLLDF